MDEGEIMERIKDMAKGQKKMPGYPYSRHLNSNYENKN